MLLSLPFLYLRLLEKPCSLPLFRCGSGLAEAVFASKKGVFRTWVGQQRDLHYDFCLPGAWPALPEQSATDKSTDIALSQAQQPQILLSVNLAESLKDTSGLRVKQHGINLKTTAFIFSSILEKPVWLMLVMTQQNLS